MDTVRIGIIGTGIIAQEHLQRYASIPGAQVIAACDLIESKVQATCAKFNIPHAYTDYRKLLERDDLDAVDVCVHNNLHAPLSVAVMRAGKNCYCEKPMAGSYADAAAMLRASKLFDKKLHIQLAMVYGKRTRAAQRLIADGKLGNLYHARSVGYRRRMRPYVDGFGEMDFVKKETAGGGALYDMGVYHISQMLYLLGRPQVERISGKLYQEMEMNEERRAASGMNVEELGTGFVRFEGGLTLDILESWSIHSGPFGGGIIAGSLGGITLDPFAYYSFLSDMTMRAEFELDLDDTRYHRVDAGISAYDNSQSHWIAALRGQVELIDTASLALDTMLVSEGMYLSDRLGREVSVDEVRACAQSSALASQEAPFGTLEYPPCPFC